MRRNIFTTIIEDIDHRPLGYGVVAFVLMVGIFCGAFYPSVIADAEQASMQTYLTAMMRAFADTTPAILTILLQSLWKNFRLVIIIALAGFTRFGSPFLLVAEFVKGFGLGMSFAALCSAFGGGGFFLGCVAVLPQNLLYIPAYLVMGAKSMDQSIINFKGASIGRDRYVQALIPCLFAILGGIVLESLVIPFILKLVSPWFI